jgi:hypothetical protein
MLSREVFRARARTRIMRNKEYAMFNLNIADVQGMTFSETTSFQFLILRDQLA